METNQNIQKLGDGRIVWNGEIYVTEKSKRVMSIEEFRAKTESKVFGTLQKRASDYADDLIKSKVIKEWDKSWLESVYLFIATHERSLLELDEKSIVVEFANWIVDNGYYRQLYESPQMWAKQDGIFKTTDDLYTIFLETKNEIIY